jgi:hypothetical protein
MSEARLAAITPIVRSIWVARPPHAPFLAGAAFFGCGIAPVR